MTAAFTRLLSLTLIWGLTASNNKLWGALAFYMPGVAPQDYSQGDPIQVRAIKMTSSHTQLPYEYYSMPFCPPKDGKVEYKSENLGEILRGDRISNTAYVVHMDQSVKCRLLCGSKDSPTKWDATNSNVAHYRINHAYFLHLIVDNLPCATMFQMPDSGQYHYEPGFRLGFSEEDKIFINNHLKLILSYHKDEASGIYHVVGFRVETASVSDNSYTFDDENGVCHFDDDHHNLKEIVKDKENKLYFTYSVVWESSPIRWASRWDIYLNMSSGQIHWFSILNSVTVVFLLSGLVTLIIVRTLKKDIAKYNRMEDDVEDAMEETGWKLVHGDVFRPPVHAQIFVSVVGSGIQLFCMMAMTIFFAMLGMLSPASRGALLTSAIFIYEFMGLVGGYFSGRLLKTLGGKDWKRTAFLTATLYPGVVFSLGLFVNFFIWGKHSSGAIPFGTLLSMGFMWFCISLPLVYIGYYFGYRKAPYEQPVRTNQIPRQVPPQKCYMHPLMMALCGGILPFSACFVELLYIFGGIYENQFYYLFGFLFLVFIVLFVSSSQVSIITVYFSLCCENYHWWWSSFLTSGGSAIYVFLYSFYFYKNRLQIDEFVPSLLFFTYSLIMSVSLWLATGAMGFYAAFFFIRKIYASVKID